MRKVRAENEELILEYGARVEKLKLFQRESVYQPRYKHTVAVTIGVIFVNSASKDLEYKPVHTTIDSEIAYTQLLFKLLRCTEVRLFEDATKAEIIDQFKLLEKESTAFERYRQKGEVMSVLVRWIGWSVELSRRALSETDAEKLKDINFNDKPYQLDLFGLTREG